MCKKSTNIRFFFKIIVKELVNSIRPENKANLTNTHICFLNPAFTAFMHTYHATLKISFSILFHVNNTTILCRCYETLDSTILNNIVRTTNK